MSIWRPLSLSTNAESSETLLASTVCTSTWIDVPAASQAFLVSSSLSARRATRTRLQPALAKSFAVAAPMPADAPVLSESKRARLKARDEFIVRPRPRAGSTMLT